MKHLAKRLHAFADDVGDALRDIKGMAGDDAMLRWAGKSAEAFTSEFEDVPKNLKKLKKSYDLAGDALAKYWPELEKAQADSLRALEKGRQARKDLSSANGRLESANDWVKRAEKKAKEYEDEGKKKDVPPPDEKDVRAATRNATNAGEAKESAQGAVDSANSALAAAKRMAEDARKLREDAASACKRKLEEASDAGIQNRSWWEEGVDWVSDNWDTIVTVCKVVVAVVGIIAMIIGGPILGAIVLVAALVVLADTLHKYANGEASLWDVAFAALDCIPGMKGLTSLGGLAKGLKGLAAGGLKGMANGIKGLAKSGRTMLTNGAKGAYNRLRTKVKGCGDPVDVATGQMFLEQTDLTLLGVLPLVFTRRVASGYRTGRWFGPSWTSTVDQRLEVDDEGSVFVTEDGMLLAYPPAPASGPPVHPEEGPKWPLEALEDGGYRITDPVGGRYYHFGPAVDGDAWLLRLEDRHGNGLTFERTEDGTPLAIRHTGGYHVRLATEAGRVVQLSLVAGAEDGSDVTIRRYGFQGGDNLTEVYASGDTPLRFGYDDRLRLTSWTDTNDSHYTYSYDDLDRCTAQGGTAGHLVNTFAYDRTDPAWPGARVTAVSTPDGSASRFVIDDSCQVIAEIDPLGGTIRREFDENHHLVAVTDQLGHTTRFVNDEGGRLTRVIRPDGSVTRYDYDAGTGLPTSLVMADGSAWERAYDDRGLCTAITDPLGVTTHYTYSRTGALASSTDALGRTTTVRSDPAGLPVEAVDPRGAVTRWERDRFGRTVRVTDPLGHALRLTWSTEGHLVSRVAPDGTGESWTYDGEGNCTSHTDPLGAVSRFEYTHFDLLAARTEPDGARHAFAYDAELRLTAVIDPNGAQWSYTYDQAGRLIAETDYEGRTVDYTLDRAGNIVERTDAAGQVITYTHDVMGNVVRKSTAERVTDFTYDVLGRLVRACDGETTLTFERDRAGRVLSESVNGRTVSHTYDAVGLRESRTTPTGATSRWAYDAADNVEQLTVGGRTIRFDHDLAGLERERHIDGHLRMSQSFDDLGRLISQSVTGPQDRSLQRRSWEYRADGHLAAVEDQLGGARTFQLDPVGRVTAVHAGRFSEHYAYDGAGNQTHASWPAAYPGQEAVGPRRYDGTRLTSAGNTRYQYDGLGRITQRRRTRLSRKPETWHYRWDSEDRLTETVTPDGTRWRYLYDPLGRRIAKERLAADGRTVCERTDFAWDGTHLCEQTTHSEELPDPVTLTWDHYGLRPVAQTERIGADLSQEEIDSRFYAIVTDLVGAPTELVDEHGRVAWRTRTNWWGVTAWAADSSAYTPLRFPGQYYDPETGLHYNYFRHYDPETARYLTLDPLGVDPAPNPYAYVENPQSLTDPLGLTPCDEADVTWGGRVQYGAPGPGGRATGMRATIDSSMTGGRTNPQVNVPGYEKYKKLNKTHLLGAQIGGSNKDPRNFVTMHRFANSPVMRKIEDQIRAAVDNGETIDYTVTPVYATNDPTDVVPLGLTIEARGDKGFSFTPYGADSATNAVTVLNVPKPAIP
nr:DUF6531 domain-containing protein [Streptomyces sp. Ru87]